MDPTSIGSLGSAAAVVVVVGMFLKYLSYLRATADQVESARIEEIGKIGEDCRQHSENREERMVEVLDRNTAAMDRNLESHGKVLQALDELNRNVACSPKCVDTLQSALLLHEKKIKQIEKSA
tara:strand:+ start:113 stop:481 length:369 start_codon:yes stop_codon:yes gene_type:complete